MNINGDVITGSDVISAAKGIKKAVMVTKKQ
jgi:hypothetical protein